MPISSSCNCQLPSCSNCGLCRLCQDSCQCSDLPSQVQAPPRKRRRQSSLTPLSPIFPKDSTTTTTNNNNNNNTSLPCSRDRLRSVLRILGIDARTLSRLHTNDSDDSRALRSAHAILQKVLIALSPLLYPSDPSTLIASYPEPGTTQKSGQEKLLESVIAAMKATKRGTVARRYVRSILCGKMTRAQVNQLLASIDNQQNHHQQNQNHDDDNADDDDDDIDDETSKPEKIKNDDDILKVSGKTFSRARRDFDMLIQCGELQLAKYGRSKVQDDSLQRLLTFLYSTNNVSLTSWTSQRLVVEDKKLDLPALVTSKTGSHLHQEYCKHLETLGQNPLSRGSFYSVLNTLTRRELRRTLPLDKPTRILVKDPLILVRDLIVRLIPYPDRTHFLKEIDKTEWFLTHSLGQSHLGSDCNGLHDLKFALIRPELEDQHLDDQSRATHCKGCIYPFLVLDEIHRTAPFGDREAVGELTSDCRNKFIYFLSYLSRKTVQEKAIEEAAKEIISKKLENRIIVCMNYFQGTELSNVIDIGPLPHLSDSLIHGCCVFYLDGTDTMDGKNIELKPKFYNHLINPDEQASPFIIASSIIEALLSRIHTDIPTAKEIIFVSDGTPMYRNESFLSSVPFLCRRLGFQTIRFLFSCSQISEFLCRAQFEGMLRQVKQDLRDLTLLTPERLVNLVRNDSALYNHCIEVLGLGPQAANISKQIDAVMNQTSITMLGTYNDIVYYNQENQVSFDSSSDVRIITAQINSFAGISKGEIVEVTDHVSGIFEEYATIVKFNNTTPQTVVQDPLNDVSIVNGNDKNEMSRSIGKQTGVRILASSWKKRKGNICLPPLPNHVTEGVLIDTIARLQISSIPRSNIRTESYIVEDQNIGFEISNRTCSDCGRSFKSNRFLKSHTCKGPPGDKDVSARAVYLACRMYERKELPIFVDHSEQIWTGSVFAADEKSRPITGLRPGWAIERGLEDLMEMGSSLRFRDEVFLWLENEERNGSNSTVTLYSYLRRKYEEREEIPCFELIERWKSIYEAKNRIRPYMQVSGDDGIAAITTIAEECDRNVGRPRMKQKYVEKITELHKQELERDEAHRSKPRHLFQQFEDFFKDEHGCVPPDFPDHKQVMNKINALRSKSKQNESF